MTEDRPRLTFDDFVKRFIQPRAEAGDVGAQYTMEAFSLAKEGKMTPELAREYARKAIP